MSRPLDSTSVDASSLARTTGFRCGNIMMPVPSRILVVCPATNASEIAGSSIGYSAGTGDGGACGSGKITCSPVHTLSNPASSAARATAAAHLGNAHGPLLIPNNPNFMNDDYHDRRTAASCGAAD